MAEKGRRAKWWRRIGSSARRFSYRSYEGCKITDEKSLQRIRSLAIPPAWKHVRISPSPRGKLQAVGVDAAERLQYIYHARFAEMRQRKKFARIERFGEYMPRLRQITNEHISLDGFTRDKVLAIMTRLMNLIYIRVGTDTSEKKYRTFGITTLRKRHITISRTGKVVFQFVGKSSVKHRKVLIDTDLAALLKELKKLGRGRKLFQYFDDEEKLRPVKPAQLNAYIKSLTSNEHSAKDFRTWGATLLAAIELAKLGICEDDKQIQKNTIKAVKKVAKELGNTPSVCRSSYIHPGVFKAYARGLILDSLTPMKLRRTKRIENEFVPEEASLLEMLKKFD